MTILFDNPAFLQATATQEAAPALGSAMTKAVALCDPAWKSLTAEIAAGITFSADLSLAQDYTENLPGGERKKYAGQNEYLAPFVSGDFLAEAATAGVTIDPQALESLTQHANDLRTHFETIHREYSPAVLPVVGRILFTPKGGIGRSPILHVDNVDLSMLFSFNLASARLLTGNASKEVWAAMSAGQNKKSSEETRRITQDWLTCVTCEIDSELTSAPVGTAMLLKGQKDRDLLDPSVQDSVCPHASSPFIKFLGQASVLFYPKNPSTSPELTSN